jgi:hypothetical protein
MVVFIIDNTDGQVVAWSTDYSYANVLPVRASHTRLITRMMVFDGSDWIEVSKGHRHIPERGEDFDWVFKMVDENDFATPETGVEPEVMISMDAGVFVVPTGTPTVTELGYGWYQVTIPGADMDASYVILKAWAVGCAQTDLNIYTVVGTN